MKKFSSNLKTLKILCFFLICLFINACQPDSDSTDESNAQEKEAVKSVANPKDIRQANKFLSDLPRACSNSKKWIEEDGSVTIHVSCYSSEKRVNSYVTIKDGIVQEIIE